MGRRTASLTPGLGSTEPSLGLCARIPAIAPSSSIGRCFSQSRIFPQEENPNRRPSSTNVKSGHTAPLPSRLWGMPHPTLWCHPCHRPHTPALAIPSTPSSCLLSQAALSERRKGLCPLNRREYFEQRINSKLNWFHCTHSCIKRVWELSGERKPNRRCFAIIRGQNPAAEENDHSGEEGASSVGS